MFKFVLPATAVSEHCRCQWAGEVTYVWWLLCIVCSF